MWTMCLDARLLPHKLVNMNMNQNDKVFQNSKLNFNREKEHVWGPHVSDTIFLNLSLWRMLAVCVIIQVQINKKTQNTHYFEIVKVCTTIVHKAVIIFIESHNITFYDSTSYTTLYKVLSQLFVESWKDHHLFPSK